MNDKIRYCAYCDKSHLGDIENCQEEDIEKRKLKEGAEQRSKVRHANKPWQNWSGILES